MSLDVDVDIGYFMSLPLLLVSIACDSCSYLGSNDVYFAVASIVLWSKTEWRKYQ